MSVSVDRWELVQSPEPVVTKDELNLCEFPFALLTDRAPKGVKTLLFSDVAKRPDGTTLQRRWTITGGDAYGLPTASDEPVYLALMEQAKRQGFESRRVEFTCYELLKRLGMPDDGKSYRRLRASLLRLNGVSITADSAFYDVSRKDYKKTFSFHILEAFSLEGGAGSRNRSYVRFSEELWYSIEAGSIKSLDFTAYLALSGSISRRLYRFLDKVIYDQKRTYNIGLRKLAFERLGMSRSYYPSDIKRLLNAAHSELVELGFLSSVEYRNGKDDEVVTYRFHRSPQKESELVEELTQRGMTLSAARRLVRQYPADQIKAQLNACDQEKPNNPGAWLRVAIQEGYCHQSRQDDRREAVRPLYVSNDPPDSKPPVSDEQIESVKAQLGPDRLRQLEEQITAEVLNRPIYRGRGLTAGAKIIVQSRLREELEKLT